MKKAALILSLIVLLAWLLWPKSHSSEQESATLDSSGRTYQQRSERDAKMHGHRKNACIVRGTVIRTDGVPIPNASVTLIATTLESIFMGGVARDNTILTNEEGGFSMVLRKFSRGIVSASAPGHLPDESKVVSCDAKVTLTLQEGGVELTGVVSDLGGGPIGGVVVSVGGGMPSGKSLFSGALASTSGDDGRYRLNLKPGNHVVRVWHENYVATAKPIRLDTSSSMNFIMVPAGGIEGRVVNQDNEPVAGLTVGAKKSSQRSGQAFRVNLFNGDTTTTDSEGKFVLSGIEAGPHTVEAIGPGYATEQPRLVSIALGEVKTDVVVRVKPSASIRGKVINAETKEPIEGVVIAGFNMAKQTLAATSNPSDLSGNFEIHGVPDGYYALLTLGKRFRPTFLETNVTVDGEDVNDVQIKLDEGIVVRGRVSPPTKATVSLSYQVEMSEDTKMLAMIRNTAMGAMVSVGSSEPTDADGNFTIYGAAPGKYSVVAKAEDERVGQEEVVLTKDRSPDPVVIELAEGAAIEGKVLDQNGKLVAGAAVVAKKSPREDGFPNIGDLLSQGWPATTSKDGKFRIGGLSEDNYQLSVKVESQELELTKPEDIELKANETKKVTVRVKRHGGKIAGQVVGESGEGLDGAIVMVQSWRVRKRVMTDADGAFEFSGLKERDKANEDMTYTIVARGGRYGTQAKVTAKVGDSNVTLKLLQGGNVVGRSQNGNDNYKVTIKQLPELGVISPDAGTFTVRNISVGNYDLLATSSFGYLSKNFEVTAGKTTQIEMTLGAWSQVSGVLVDKEGVPQKGVSVTASCEKNPQQGKMLQSLLGLSFKKTAADGSFNVGKLVDGKCTLAFLGDTPADSHSHDVELKLGESKTDVRVVLGEKNDSETNVSITVGN